MKQYLQMRDKSSLISYYKEYETYKIDDIKFVTEFWKDFDENETLRLIEAGLLYHQINGCRGPEIPGSAYFICENGLEFMVYLNDGVTNIYLKDSLGFSDNVLDNEFRDFEDWLILKGCGI